MTRSTTDISLNRIYCFGLPMTLFLGFESEYNWLMFIPTPAEHYNIIYTSDSTTRVIAPMDSAALIAIYQDVEELT